MTDTNKCRLGCPDIENYNHLFISCPNMHSLNTHIENIMKNLGFSVKISMKTLIFGYKLISHIFYTIYKYWLKNDRSINLKGWVFSQLKQLKSVYYYTKDNSFFLLLNKFIEKWTYIKEKGLQTLSLNSEDGHWRD